MDDRDVSPAATSGNLTPDATIPLMPLLPTAPGATLRVLADQLALAVIAR
jgi:hypothetical protein